MHPAYGVADKTMGHRLGVALRAYGVPEREWEQVVDVILERTQRLATQIREGAARGEQPWVTLLAEGHDVGWQSAVDHYVEHREDWLREALGS